MSALQMAQEFLKPSLGASVWKTFHKLTALLLFFLWLIALPLELILHRRVGKRHMNTLFFGFSLTMLATLGWQGMLAWTLFSPMTAPDVLTMTFTLGGVLSLACIGFVCHHQANRRRFDTREQAHSLDAGIPWIIYPPFTRWFVNWAERRNLDLTLEEPEPREEPSNGLGRLYRRLCAPGDRLDAHGRHHVEMLLQGKHPYGPFLWFVLAFAEPAALAMVGAMLLLMVPAAAALGPYLIVVGLAMFLKGRIHEAEWRERVYDDIDQKLEAEAMRAWREGKAAAEIAPCFTVPLSGAVVATPRRAVEPIGSFSVPGFEHLLTAKGVQPTPAMTDGCGLWSTRISGPSLEGLIGAGQPTTDPNPLAA